MIIPHIKSGFDVNYNDYRVSSYGQLKKPHCSSHHCVLVIFFWELATWWGIPPVQVSSAATNVMLPHQRWCCCRPTSQNLHSFFRTNCPIIQASIDSCQSKGGSAFEDPRKKVEAYNIKSKAFECVPSFQPLFIGAKFYAYSRMRVRMQRRGSDYFHWRSFASWSFFLSQTI